MNVSRLFEAKREYDVAVNGRLTRHIALEAVIGGAEDAYFKATGRTRHQFAIDLIEFVADRFASMNREEMGKEYMLAVAAELNTHDGDEARQERRIRAASLRRILTSSVVMLPHRLERAPGAPS